MVEEYPYLGLERRRCHCKHPVVPLNIPIVDHTIVGSRLDHRSAVLRRWSQSVPLVIVVGDFHRYVMLVAILGSFVYNTCAILPFHPFTLVSWNATSIKTVSDNP